ncbi:6-pyruvoyl tetrahydropterin synthase [Halobacteriales archaeon QS_3_64_16]|nr:MAG: 6-pyruvoyl tetrahydropterin synthase [Halobacteriales archaeon QS_3_64_16]
MHAVTVADAFIAQYYLTVPNAGPEGDPHSREYGIELTFEGSELDEYGYLLDIDEAKAALEAIEERYTDQLLNDLPEFEDTNPSVERFAREIATRVAEALALESVETVETLRVTLREDESAWAAYEHSVSGASVE